MQEIYLNHPTEDALERFILNHANEEELEILETHILACESCVTRLEDLELHITATKLALHQVRSEQLSQQAAREQTARKNWFTIPHLSWAGGLAALTLGMILIPHMAQQRITQNAADVELTAYRGSETSIVPAGHPLHISLNATDLENGPVMVELVNDQGSKVWQGASNVNNDKVEISLPRISQVGTHFLRLYTGKSSTAQGDLLREFAFQVK